MGGTVKYLTIGKLPWRHLLWFGAIGGVGGYTGQRVVKQLIKKTGRPSYVVFILGGIIALAVLVMTLALLVVVGLLAYRLRQTRNKKAGPRL